MIQPDKIIRSNRKTLSVCIDHFGRVTVRAPKRCGEERIFSFLKEKEDWICSHVAKKKGAKVILPSENLDGYSFLLLGKPCVIHVTNEKKTAFNAQTYELFLPREKAKEKLLKWLKNNAKRIFTAATKEWAERMGVHYRSVSVTSAKTRWGSCSGQDAIRYTFRLLYAPKDVIEYVIIHELSHVKEKNHSQKFWAEVEKFQPPYKAKRKWLKDHGYLTQIF
jgi:predicted metal-dependent hydrolase